MDAITIWLICLAAALAILSLILLARFLGLRAELKAFSKQVNEIRTTERDPPVKVASFDVSSVRLAQEINQLIAELRKAAVHSAEEEKRVRTIMAGVSHDFRTPLTAADGYLQMSQDLLRKEEMSREDLTELRDYLKIVSERIRYLQSLSDEFFEVTYLDAKKELPLSEVRFDTVLSEVLLGQYDRMQEKCIDMRIHIPEEQLPVRADRHYLERILENLLSNAAKYAKSYLELQVERTGDKAGEAQEKTVSGEEAVSAPIITLFMRNDVDETFQTDTEHIFEPFYRAKGRSGPGTGLGLYVCKELADAMGFTLTGEIKEGVFELRLTMPEYCSRQDSSLRSE